MQLIICEMAEINIKSRLAFLPPSGYMYKTKFNIDWKQTIQKGKKAHIWLSKNYLSVFLCRWHRFKFIPFHCSTGIYSVNTNKKYYQHL